MPKAKGAKGNPRGRGAKIVRSGQSTASLAEQGITKDQSADWQSSRVAIGLGGVSVVRSWETSSNERRRAAWS